MWVAPIPQFLWLRALSRALRPNSGLNYNYLFLIILFIKQVPFGSATICKREIGSDPNGT